MFRLFLALALAATALSARADVDYSHQIDQQALSDVLVYIEHKDCAGAIGALNKGIAKKQRAVLLLAGSLYEQGLCLKRDWDRAAYYYQMSHEAGNVAALPRLVAGHAEQGRNPVAALWWLAQSQYVFAPACASANTLVGDPDAFISALQKWPAGQIDACAYVAGVVMRLVGEVEFPAGRHQGVFASLSRAWRCRVTTNRLCSRTRSSSMYRRSATAPCPNLPGRTASTRGGKSR